MLRAAIATVLANTLAGCGGVLDPQGPVGAAEKILLLDSLAIMMVVVLPAIAATLLFAWWYRAGNPRARRLPTFTYSGRLEFVLWSIPALIVLFLGGIAWIASHQLDPYRKLESDSKPVEVQVVSLDWKWLFIYPDLGVASVNALAVPAGRPVHFSLTSATVMNSFFVPQLGSQIYTMAGMTTELHLQADRPGTYPGLSVNFSGDGFPDMHFAVQALDPSAFDAWVSNVRGKGGALDLAAYQALLSPGTVQPRTWGSVEPGLFREALHLSMMPPSAAHGETATGTEQ